MTDFNLSTTNLAVTRRADVALITLGSRPVNSLTVALRKDLLHTLESLNGDDSVTAVVLASALKVFSAGADLREMEGGSFQEPNLNVVCQFIESMKKPVVAFIEGHALGGGLELALSCHSRVATSAAKLALPEVKLGLLPGGGGTQRLPRLVPLADAAALILSGDIVNSARAQSLGLVDDVFAAGDIDAVCAYASRLAQSAPVPTRAKACRGSLADIETAVSQVKKSGKALERARSEIVLALQAAVTAASFEEGMRLEWQGFERLLASSEAKALRHLFFAEKESARLPGLDPKAPTPPLNQVVVVGAGTMGTGIALSFLGANVPVCLLDRSAEALERGTKRIAETIEASVSKGRLTREAATAQLGLLTTSLGFDDLPAAELVIEAVFEKLELKQQVWRELGVLTQPGTILASNTSTLDVNVLAQASGRPEDFLGMHFFSPANIMKLLEVVRGDKTSQATLASAIRWGLQIGKIPVVSGVCDGFIGNRMMEGYLREAEAMLLEGATPRQIDQTLEQFGFAMGPCRMIDLAGVDVAASVLEQRELVGTLPKDPRYRAVCRDLYAAGRLGQKTGKGYYLYEGRKAVDDPEVITRLEALAAKLGIARGRVIEAPEIIERCVLPLINEGYRILDEGIAYRAGDIDVVWTSGYGFPREMGGPMFYATTIGPATALKAMNKYAAGDDSGEGYWQPAQGLVRAASATGDSGHE